MSLLPSRLMRLGLDVPASCADVVRALRTRRHLVALSGAWAGGGELVTCDPVEVVSTRAAEEGLGLLHEPDDAVGWFGYIGFGGLGVPTRPRIVPGAWAGRYRWVLQRRGGRWELLTRGLSDEESAQLALDLTSRLASPPASAAARMSVTALPDLGAHVVAVEEAIRAIRRGDIYQVNVTTGLHLALHGHPTEAWLALRERLAPARAAYVDTGSGVLVGASPELFLERRGDAVRTAPIKGTRPAGTPAQAEHETLAESMKDAGENVMIVDLMRNDLSRVCDPGSVHVPHLLRVQPHAGVWHLVSDVAGQLRDGVATPDLMTATFPPGSISGVPKLRALQIISEIEGEPRGAYTGTAGFASHDLGTELNVAIRTFEVAADGQAWLGVGGGVTADSTPVEEWDECLVKAAPLLDALGVEEPLPVRVESEVADASEGLIETMRAVDGRVLHLADHLSRLRRSAWEAYRAHVPDPLDDAVRAEARGVGDGMVRLHLRVSGKDVSWDVTTRSLIPADGLGDGVRARIVGVGPEGLPRHKFADRTWFAAREAEVGMPPPGQPSTVAAVFVDDAGLVLETSRANVFAVIDGMLHTPPLDGRILPGVTRQVVLDLADDHRVRVNLGPLRLADLARADGIFLTGALRGVQWVTSIDGPGWSAAPRATWASPDPLTLAMASRLAALA